MTLQLDPIWPWKLLFQGLTAAPPSVVAAVLSAGVVALALPILLVRPTASWRRRRLLLGCGLVLVGLLTWAAVDHAWETPLEMTTAGGGLWTARLAGFGLALLYVVPMGLAGITAATYLGSGRPARRVAVILSLRGAAFVLAAIAILRPSLGFPKDGDAGGSVFYIVLDASKSMTIQDESDRPRWEAMLKALRDAGAALDKLRKDQNVRVELYRFADKTEPFNLDSPGAPDGKRTDVGGMLRWLEEQNGGRRVRGLALLSDGRNNGGQRTDPFAAAGRWRRLGPIYTFGFGSPNTPNGQSDVAVANVVATPSVTPTKGKISVRATIDAHGFENRTIHVRLFLDGKQVKEQDEPLPLSAGNKIVLETDAPDRPGEMKVTVKVDPLAGEKDLDDNQRDTIVTVIKGGVNVLLIDKERAWEPQLIYDALARDPRIQVKPLWLRGSAPIEADVGKLFDFDKQKYDVIIIGDVTAAQMRTLQPDVLGQIRDQVDRGAGFLMIGGYASFGGDPNDTGTGDWKDTVIAGMLPVDLNVGGQVEGSPLYGLKMAPTDDGLRLYSRVVGLTGGDAQAEKAAWEAMQNPYGLQGANRLALRNPPGLAVVLAEWVDPQTQQHYPLLVEQDYGAGRVLAFAGDTTNRWIHDRDSKRKHDRFWRQMILWLARQDEGEDQARVVPDVRSVSTGEDLGFSLGLRAKNGQDVKDADYEVEVIGPDGQRKSVTPTREGGEDRGVFRPQTAGEYTIHVKGRGKDAEGQDVQGDASARFFVYEEEVEMAEWAADEDFLNKMADEGRGEYHRGTKLAPFLEQLPPLAPLKTKAKTDQAPDWSSASWSPFFVLFFLLFTGLLAAEWLLRRRWGMI
jgi:uncharacterized membrane protein